MANPKVSIEISAKLDNLERDFGRVSSLAKETATKVESAFGGVGNSFKRIAVGLSGAFSANMFIGMIKGAIDAQDKINDLSKSTGIAVEDLAGLGSAARKSGANLEDIAAAINKLSVNIGKEPVKFREIGITAKEPIEALKQLADVFVAIKDPQERAAFAAAALGKSWAGTAPLLAEGSKSIGEMVAKGTQLSKVTAESARAADELNDKLEELETASQGTKTAFANLLIPSLTQTATAMQELTEKGNPLLAVLRGLAGIGKIPFDLAIKTPDINTKTQLEDLNRQLGELESKRDKAINAGGGLINDWVFGKPGELEQKILTTKNQIAALQKYGEQIDARKNQLTTPADPNKKPPDVRKFLDGTPSIKTGAVRKDTYTDLLTPAAQAYAKTIENINSALNNANKSTMELDASESALYDLMNSATWKDFPEAWKEVVIAQSEAASEAIKTADNYKKLKDLLDATPTAKLEEMRDKMLLLAKAFEEGTIDADKFSEAAQTALGTLPDAAKEAADEMDVFVEQAARNMQDAFANFLFDPFEKGTKSMLQSFGETIKRMVANAVSADLFGRLFGKKSGGEGEGWLGDILKLFKGLGGGDSGGFGDLSGLAAGVPQFAVGTPYVTRSGLAMIHQGERIIPAAQNNSRLGATNIVVNVNGNASVPDVRRAAGQGAREAMAAINGAGRYR